MSSSRIHTTFTGAPFMAFETRPASTAKSGFDFRPKPPPSKVTWTVTFSGARPSVLGQEVVGGLRALHAGPALAFAVDDARCRRRRFHRRVREMGDVSNCATTFLAAFAIAASKSPAWRAIWPDLAAVCSSEAR